MKRRLVMGSRSSRTWAGSSECRRRDIASSGQPLRLRWRRGRALAPPGQRGLKPGSNALLAITRQHLARAALSEGGRAVELDDDLDRAETQHPPKMRRHRHPAIPSKEWPQRAPDRHAVEPGIGDRHRLNSQSLGTRLIGDAEQGAFKRKNAVAVAARSLREQDQRVLRGQAPGNAVALLYRAAHPTVDKDRALQFRQPSEQRPLRHLALGNKRAGDQRTEDGDIEIGHVIGGEQHLSRGDRLPDPADPETEYPATRAVVKPRERCDPGPPQP